MAETHIYADNDIGYYDIETDTTNEKKTDENSFDRTLYTTSDMKVFVDHTDDTVVIRQFYPEEEYKIPRKLFTRLSLMMQKEIVQAERDRWISKMIGLLSGRRIQNPEKIVH